MRGGLVTAWLFGMGLITWQSVAKEHHPPIPGRMMAASGFFALLALAAEYPPAAGAAALTGWGVDLAVLLCLLDKACLPGAATLGGKSAQGSGLAGLQKIARQQHGGPTGTTQAPGTTTAGGRG